MLQGELWAKRLASEVGIELETSLQLWSALVTQLENRLGSGQRINFSCLGLWSLCLQPEYILETSQGELLIPPSLSLELGGEETSLSIALIELAPSLELATEIRASIIEPWLEAIPSLSRTLLEAGYEVHWQGLGVWAKTEQSLSFCISEDFAESLNKPFACFVPESWQQSTGEDLVRVKGELDDLRLQPQCLLVLEPIVIEASPSIETEVIEDEPLLPVFPELEGSAPEEEIEQSEEDTALISLSKEPAGKSYKWLWWLLLLLAVLALVWGLGFIPRAEKPAPQPVPTVSPDALSSKVEQPEPPIRVDSLPATNAFTTTPSEESEPELSTPAETPRETKPVPQEQKPQPEPVKPQPKTSTTLPAHAELAEEVALTTDESLAVLAQRKYGHRAFWVYIYEENREHLPNPHNVPVGTRLQLPPASKYGIDPKNTKSVQQALVLSKTIQ
ncbi:MAG: hypothetical protein SPK09_08540 [Porphyromonas sp.]|nr:hypothetical protein [Porphyromonas sp.]